MFKSLKRKPEKVKEKLDFKLGFHATRVPLQGWDKLVISVIPYETGRPVAKTPRAVVKNGECHWPDSIIETTRMVYDTRTNSYEEKKYRFMVSSGSSRTGVLGEVTINFGDFAASKHPQQKGLALRNCTTNTLLHVTVTCLTPKSHDSVKDSDRTTKPGNDADEEDSVASDSDDMDKLNRASSNGHLDSSRKPSMDSPPLSPSSGTRKLQQRGISTSSLRYSSSSFDSLEVPSTPGATSFTDSMQGYPGENLSSSSSFASQPEKLDRSRETVGVDSKPSSPLPNLGHKRTFSTSAASGGNQQVRQSERTQMQGEFRETSGATIEDLRKSSLKLSCEVEDLNRKLEKNVQVNKEKEMELSALTAERDGLKQEVEKLKSTMHASRDPESVTDESRWAVEDAQRVIQELKEEIMSEKNTISSLNEQLQKTQQYNMKLVSEIDELLDAAKSNDSSHSLAQVESDWTKKLAAKDDEIKDLQARIMHLEERHSHIQTSVPPDTGDTLVNGLQNMVKQLQQDVEELEADSIRLTDENTELHTKLESSSLELIEKSKLIDDLKASGSTSQPRAPDNLLKQLQQDIEELEAETNRLTDENAELRANLGSSSSELSEKNRLIADLKASESTPQPRVPDNLLKQLQQDVEELEAETNRLADENEELRSNLESSSSELSEKNKLIGEMRTSEGAVEGRAQLLGKVASLEGELNRLQEDITQILSEKEETEKSIQRLQTENQELQKSIRRLENGQPESIGRVQEREVANNQLFQQLAETVTILEEELQDSQEESRLSRLHIQELEREILALTSSGHTQSSTEVESLRKLLESEKLDKENIQRSAEERTRVMQEHLDHALKESELLKEKLEELRKEMKSADSRAAELEVAKTFLEGKLAALEEEKLRISNRVSGLELQLKYMTEERDHRQQEAGVVEEEKSILLSERERLQNALDSTTQKHQDLVRHLTEELDEAIKECEGFKSSQHHLEQEVMRLQGELEEAHHDQREHTKVFENSRAMLEESFHSISRDHANAVAESKTLEAQVAQLQSDLEDMDMRSATEVRTLSMLKESEQHRAEKAEQALQQSALLQRKNSTLQKRVAELELLLEDERASYSADKNGTSNGHRKSSNGDESHELGGLLKAMEMEKMKQEFVEKESSLLNEIERLELANEQLIQGAPDSDLQQLQVELTRLQNQNAALNRHIKELESQLNTRDMLQSEVERLQEVNERLDNRLQKYKAAAAGSNMVERVVHLETELAEAMEANNMYKSQLRTAFAEQQNVHAVALQNFGDVDTVVNDLVELRKRVKQLEGELRDMRDRYSAMSLRFAEVEGEREELVMTIRTLRNRRR